MPTDVLMPKLADTLVEGTVAHWLKAANDVVQAGEPIVEIENIADIVGREFWTAWSKMRTGFCFHDLPLGARHDDVPGCDSTPTADQARCELYSDSAGPGEYVSGAGLMQPKNRVC